MRALLLLIMVGGITALPSAAWAQTYRVGSGCTHATIQAAVDAIPSNGTGTIRARNQTFNESVSIVNKTVTLIGGHSDCADTNPSGFSTLDANGTDLPVLNLFVNSNTRTLRVDRFDLQGGSGVVAPFVPFPAGGLNVWTAAGTTGNLILDNVWIFSNTSEYTGGGLTLHGDGSGIATLRNNTRIFSNQVTGDDAFGGGLFCSGDYAMVMRGGMIDNNTAGSASDTNGRGGGLYLDGCTMSWFAHPTATGSTGSASLHGNTAHGYGGGLYATGGASVFLRGAHDSGTPTSTGPFVIRNNNAINDGAIGIIGFGGAIYATGSSTSVVADRTWIHNHDVPRNGGAIHVTAGAEVTIERSSEVCHNPRRCSRLFDNSASGVGGAIYATGDTSKVTVRRSMLTGNSGQPYYIADGATLEVTDSLIHGDAGTDYAFTTWASSSSTPTTTVRIRRSTIADTNPNFAVFRLIGGPANLILQQNIVHEQSFVDVVTIQSGSPSISIDCVLWHKAPTGISTSRTLVDDPQFVDRGNNNYYLNEGSRAINYCDTVPPPPGVDLEWNPRGITQTDPSPLHGVYDLGAYEIETRLFRDRFED
jgi:predicted outer membrane repeat protein